MAKKHSKSNEASEVFKHKSFKRSYREDYRRDLNAPGVAEHIAKSFGLFFRNWKIFIPFCLAMILTSYLTIGMTDLLDGVAADVLAMLFFLVIWLVTIFVIRHILAGREITLRQALYNAMTPLISTLVVLAIVILECIPIFLVIIAYSAAIKTDFLSTPFYALVFFVFVAIMLVISIYLLTSSVVAFVAVTAPGLYPLLAIRTASKVVAGRRIKFLIRLVALIMIIALIWAVIILPLTALNINSIVLSIVIAAVLCFDSIYAAIYLYLFYRWLIDDEN
ncbi:hypothetical protein IJH26_01895 [Candidatus Saccharibacteria bacterium]|nr:hypothetical protein [Candidatus Saccharibacteria bacterium]MBQ3476242.1 hypothetical protein [Candidatus Saccharibacteria bacterium]